jgi:hypothetical protein
MDRKPSAFWIGALAVFAFIVLTLAPTVCSRDADALTAARQRSAGPSAVAPIIVAQGRCYNGKCY